MDILHGLLSLLLDSILAFGAMMATTWVGLLGLSTCLFAVQVVLVQPSQPRDQVGVSAAGVACMVAVPLVVVGFAAMVWAWGVRP